MREIIPDRIKNCKNYKKILPKVASKGIESPKIALEKKQMLIKMLEDFFIN